MAYWKVVSDNPILEDKYLSNQIEIDLLQFNLLNKPMLVGEDRYFNQDIRTYKNRTYMYASELLKKYQIKGSYCGLAHVSFLEIVWALKQRINKSFISYQLDSVNARQVDNFMKMYKWLLKDTPIVKCRSGDILKDLVNRQHKSSIIDLDLMDCLNTQEKVTNVGRALFSSSAHRYLAMIWQCRGRAITNEQVNEGVRKTLRLQALFTRNYNLLDHVQIDYLEVGKHIPMSVDIFIMNKM